MKIPNRAVGALVIVFLLAGPLVLPWPEYASRWLHLGTVLLIGFGLTLAGLIGAGDAKFVAAMAPFVDRDDAATFLLLTAAVVPEKGWELDEKSAERRLVCRSGNPWGLPAKDRSGRLDLTEPPDLGALIAKINAPALPAA